MFGFLIAVAAGFLTPHIETPLARPVAKTLSRYIPLEAEETRLLAFMIALFGAAVIAGILDTGSTTGIVVGAILGYFLLRISAVVRAAIDGRSSG